jgi:hypothetical protein
VAQPQCDHADVDAGLQQMHHRRVANHMRRDVALTPRSAASFWPVGVAMLLGQSPNH